MAPAVKLFCGLYVELHIGGLRGFANRKRGATFFEIGTCRWRGANGPIALAQQQTAIEPAQAAKFGFALLVRFTHQIKAVAEALFEQCRIQAIRGKRNREHRLWGFAAQREQKAPGINVALGVAAPAKQLEPKAVVFGLV